MLNTHTNPNAMGHKMARKICCRSVASSLVIVSCLIASVRAVEPSFAQDERQKRIDDFTRHIVEIADVVLRKHIDPPTRQAMFLAGFKAAVVAKGSHPPPELSERVSNLKSPEEVGVLIQEFWPEADLGEKHQKIREPRFTETFLQGMLEVVPGRPTVVSRDDARVGAQLQANRYVGIGVALGYDKTHAHHTIQQVIPGGSAEKAGIKPGDIIEQIDDVIVDKKMRLKEVVEITRGEEETKFTMRVRQPDAKESRTVNLVRLPIMIPTVHDDAGPRSAEVDNEIGKGSPVAYLSINNISASTAHELRKREAQLRAAGKKALVLDMRFTSNDAPGGHAAAAVLADSLLDGGSIGTLQTRDGIQHFQADRDCLFRGGPMAVLVSGFTAGEAEWVVGALQDNGRAQIMGKMTYGDFFNRSAVPLSNGNKVVVLATGILKRSVNRKNNARGRKTGPVPIVFTDEKTGKLMVQVDAGRQSGPGVTPDFIIDSVKSPPVPGQRVRESSAAEGWNAVVVAAKKLKQQLDAVTEPSTPVVAPKPVRKA
jgi:C-terminal peptidase prc